MGDANLSATFSLVATALITPLPLTWLSNTLVWVDQWPLKGERLEQTCLLVKQQLEAGHIEPSNSPWNTYEPPTAGHPQSSLHSKGLATFSY